MLKKALLFSSLIMSSSLFASNVSKEDCTKKGDNFIFAGNECNQFYKSKGDTQDA